MPRMAFIVIELAPRRKLRSQVAARPGGRSGETPTMMRKAACIRAAALVLAALLAVTAAGDSAQGADAYPHQPIKLIVPWPPGGGVDTSARMIAKPLARAAGPGRSSSTTAPAPAATSAPSSRPAPQPDGYNLLMGSISPERGQHPPLLAAGLRSGQGLRADRRMSRRCRTSWWCRPTRRSRRSRT